MVAVLLDGAQPAGAFRREPPPDLARPRRRARGAWPLMAGRWQAVSEILERSGEGEEGAFGHLLLLEWRTAPGPQRAAVGRDGGDRLESADRAAGYFTTRADTRPKVNARTSGVYLRAEPGDVRTLDEQDNEQRAKLIADRLRHWKSITSPEIGGMG